MRLHFCDSCGHQFTSEGDLPTGATLCPDCREKQERAPAPKPGRTNTLLRASNARGTNRQRSDSRPAAPTRGSAGLSPVVVWGGILALAAMIGLLLFAFHRVNVGDNERKETVRPAPENSPVIQPDPITADRQGAKAAEAAFERLMAALEKLPKEDRATRLAKLEDFVKQYPESIYASRARTMISTIQGKPGPKTK